MQLKEVRMFQPCYLPNKEGRKLLEYINDEFHTLELNHPFIEVTDNRSGLSTWVTIYNVCYLVPHDNRKTTGFASGAETSEDGNSAVVGDEFPATDSVHKRPRKAKGGALHS